MKNLIKFSLAILCLALSLTAFSAEPVVRPKITGVAYYATFVSNLEKSRTFYQGFLGYEEAFHLSKPDGSVSKAVLKVNDHQFIMLVNEPDRGEGLQDYYAIAISSVEQMRLYLASHGVKVPEKVEKDEFGNNMIEVTDPDHHKVRFVEYLPDSLMGASRGKFLPTSRISDQLMHVGILVGNLDAANAFYGKILGCKETWRGNGPGSKTLNWVNMRLHNGSNHVEYMLYKDIPPPNDRGGQQHFCLAVRDIPKALADLESRPGRKAYPREMKIHHGVDNKLQVSVRDPNGTRIEIMAFEPVDGKPAPSSTLPPP